MNQREHWGVIRPILVKLGCDPMRIEDARAQGVPDVNISRGWIEMKQIAAWPKRAASQIPVGLTENQKRFIKRRALAGGEAYVSLAVGDDLLLFDQRLVYAIETGCCTKEWMIDNHIARGADGYRRHFAL